jgi:hypothetical protein
MAILGEAYIDLYDVHAQVNTPLDSHQRILRCISPIPAMRNDQNAFRRGIPELLQDLRHTFLFGCLFYLRNQSIQLGWSLLGSATAQHKDEKK